MPTGSRGIEEMSRQTGRGVWKTGKDTYMSHGNMVAVVSAIRSHRRMPGTPGSLGIAEDDRNVDLT